MIFNDLPDYSYDDPMGLEISIIENHSSKRQTLPSNNYNYNYNTNSWLMNSITHNSFDGFITLTSSVLSIQILQESAN